MKFFVITALSIVVLLVGGCRTIHDINYVKASEARNAGRDAEAFKRFSVIAAADGYDGQASAQVTLGQMYLTGKGTRRDPAAAIRMFEAAAVSDDKTWRRLALFDLGELHEEGLSGFLKRDRVKASTYFKKAAEDGYELAAKQFERLQRYPEVYVHHHFDEFTHHGSEMAPAGMSAAFKAFESGDTAIALKIFLWHGKSGNEEAQAALAMFFKEGIATTPDSAKYASWLWLAARNGNVRAQHDMGLLYRQGEVLPGSDAEAIYWFNSAAKQGSADAANWLGVIAAYPIDDGKKPDWQKALQHFRAAAEAGSIFALVNLGDAYLEGIGVQKDPKAAHRYFEQAAEAGNVDARRKLIELGIVQAAKIPAPSRQTKSAQKEEPAPPFSPVVEQKAMPTKPTPIEIFSKLSPSVFRLVVLSVSKGKEDMASGSAVALTTNVAVTNCHVSAGMEAVAAKIGGQVAMFRTANGDSQKDICTIRTDKTLQPVTEFRGFADLHVGEKVYAIGSPQSLENTISEGIVSGLRTVNGVRYVQTTAPITYGSSGGGLFDEEGRLIGITTKGFEGGGNLNFAVAADEVLEVLDASR